MTVKEILKHCVAELSADEPGSIHDFWRSKLDGQYKMEARYNLISEEVKVAYFAIIDAYNISDSIKLPKITSASTKNWLLRSRLRTAMMLIMPVTSW